MFDCVAQSVVRRFASGSKGHTGPISDMAFSPDGRTLYSSSLDGSLRVWDVPTNTCLDWLSFRNNPISISVSPTAEFLVVALEDHLGLSVFNDRSFYERIHSDGKSPLKPFLMGDPIPVSNSGYFDKLSIMTTQRADDAAPDEVVKEFLRGGVIIARANGLVTLSGLPPTHWKNLFHLELVKERNKPIEPPKKPPSAPFFLQWRNDENEVDKAENAIGDNREVGGTLRAEWSHDSEINDASQIHGIEGEIAVSEPPKRARHFLRSKLAALFQNRGNSQTRCLHL